MEIFSIDFLKELYAALFPEHHYANIRSPLFLIDLDFILLGLYVGIVIGAFVMCAHRARTGELVGAILSAGATSPENAKTLAELGLGGKESVIRSLKRRRYGSLIKVASNATDEGNDGSAGDAGGAASAEEAARYYIDGSDAYSAEECFGKRRDGILTAVIWAIVLIPIFLLIRFFVPELLQLLDNFITGVKG